MNAAGLPRQLRVLENRQDSTSHVFRAPRISTVLFRTACLMTFRTPVRRPRVIVPAYSRHNLRSANAAVYVYMHAPFTHSYAYCEIATGCDSGACTQSSGSTQVYVCGGIGSVAAVSIIDGPSPQGAEIHRISQRTQRVEYHHVPAARYKLLLSTDRRGTTPFRGGDLRYGWSDHKHGSRSRCRLEGHI